MSLYSALTQVLAQFAAKIKGIQTGYDGTEYNSPGEAVREQINDLHVLIGDTPGTAIQASAIAYNGSNVAAELTNVNGRLQKHGEVLGMTNLPWDKTAPTVNNYSAAGGGTLDEYTLTVPSGATVGGTTRVGCSVLFNNAELVGKKLILKPHFIITGDTSAFVFVSTKQEGNDGVYAVEDDSITAPVIVCDFTNATFNGLSTKYYYFYLVGKGTTVGQDTVITYTGYDLLYYDEQSGVISEMTASIDSLESAVANVEGIAEVRQTAKADITSLFSRVVSNKNGASTSNGVMTIPEGSTGNTSYLGIRIQGADINSVKGYTVDIVTKFTVSANVETIIGAYVLLNGAGYVINSKVWDGDTVSANITIDSDATCTYIIVGLIVTNLTALASDGTIKVDGWHCTKDVPLSYTESIESMARTASKSVFDEENPFLVDETTLNLFDKANAVTTGMYTETGAFAANNYQHSTGLIPIGTYTMFRMNRDTGTVPTWTLWDENGLFVRGIQSRGITIDQSTDSDAVYLRCSFLATEIDTVMIVPNDHPCMSEYFPYNSPRKSMKGEWVGKHLVTIGDSLTQMGYWQEMVTQMLGMSYTVAAQSGGNMTAIAGFVDSVTDADAMTVWAGTNDWYGGVSLGTLLGTDRNTYYGALRHVCEEVSANLPGCKLLFITPLQRNTTNTDAWEEDARGFKKNPTTGHTLEEFANAMIATAEIYGFPVLDMFHCGGVNKINIDAWTTDKLHPGKAQFEKLAWKILGKLKDM